MFAHTVADLGRIWYESPVFRPELAGEQCVNGDVVNGDGCSAQ